MGIVKKYFIKKYYFDIVERDDGFSIVNTHRKNITDRDGIEEVIFNCKTFEEAERYIDKLKKGNYNL
ncbi:MAG: hypothetical protein A2599_00925 [Candidatus Staskawiczbacteria bacterium RIFOXYD1_FULL_39_28]|uniref:WGR domain-containing protein n=1 Tax=Candidatus Staskawiczbacteria bacterium RIFOXYC1_FULL_38_18 TaxID=1802229 RepID=A0A1G2JBA9_9BACT|nr:MAG: hypothetical protein A2401_00500 [Candidatus Staskawiczbacteria bacterium RIFOXYC1_FULL_38_18]OGZ91225.1 MAG: hypothetical protein A2599_00925 [Candidatus Staskawiczbacteria bacterium RIFOXYD1_FULL_39_28]